MILFDTSAEAEGMSLVIRDVARVSKYFPSVKLITPLT